MFGDDSIEKCGACIEVELPEFPADDFIIHGSLTPTTEYAWFLETTTGLVYKGIADTDADGDIVIPINEFPEGLFAADAGRFVIYFKLTSEMEGDVAEISIYDGTPYEETGECLSLTFYKSPNYEDTEIG